MNYYVLLDLDPIVDDWGTIETAIKAKQSSWSTQASSGPLDKRLEAKQYLALIDDIKKVLQDETTRRSCAEAAKKELKAQAAQQLAQKLAELDNVIIITIGKGKTAYPWDVDDLLNKYACNGIDRPTVIGRLQACGIKVIELLPKLEPTTAQAIRLNLGVINKHNLYDFLGVQQNSLPKDLCAAAGVIGDDLRKKRAIDANSTAQQALVGHCLAVFKDARGKARYDNTLAIEPMDEFNVGLDAAVKNAVLEQNAIERTLEIANEKGVASDVAFDYIVEYCQQRKWRMQYAIPTPIPTSTQGTTPVTPPVVIPPITPPVVIPPITPPVVTPPITPPVVTPPITPPVVIPPITPPVVTPPVTPPVVTPPVTPPVVTPTITPPVVTPPVTPPILVSILPPVSIPTSPPIPIVWWLWGGGGLMVVLVLIGLTIWPWYQPTIAPLPSTAASLTKVIIEPKSPDYFSQVLDLAATGKCEKAGVLYYQAANSDPKIALKVAQLYDPLNFSKKPCIDMANAMNAETYYELATKADIPLALRRYGQMLIEGKATASADYKRGISLLKKADVLGDQVSRQILDSLPHN